VPVGRSLDKRKKHVSFGIEKPRPLGIELPRCDQSAEQVEDMIEITRKTAVQKKGILRNKSSEKKFFKESECKVAKELSLMLKQTEEKDI
jgi:hypothetical protein